MPHLHPEQQRDYCFVSGLLRVHANKFLNSTNVKGALLKFQFFFFKLLYRRTKNNIMFVIRYCGQKEREQINKKRTMIIIIIITSLKRNKSFIFIEQVKHVYVYLNMPYYVLRLQLKIILLFLIVFFWSIYK